LYVIIDDEKIKKTEVMHNARQNQNSESEHYYPVVFSVAEIIKKVNDKDILKYAPDELLNKNQKAKKYEAISEIIRKTNFKNDSKYNNYIREGNLEAAKQMVACTAKANGYECQKLRPEPR